MKKKKILLLLLLIITPILFSACCNCGQKGENYLEGELGLIGNEPFVQIVLKMHNNDNLFVLECDETLRKELRQKIGSRYAVYFTETKVEVGMPVLTVEKAIPITK
jgi:hypothetical protein